MHVRTAVVERFGRLVAGVAQPARQRWRVPTERTGRLHFNRCTVRWVDLECTFKVHRTGATITQQSSLRQGPAVRHRQRWIACVVTLVLRQASGACGAIASEWCCKHTNPVKKGPTGTCRDHEHGSRWTYSGRSTGPASPIAGSPAAPTTASCGRHVRLSWRSATDFAPTARAPGRNGNCNHNRRTSNLSNQPHAHHKPTVPQQIARDVSG